MVEMSSLEKFFVNRFNPRFEQQSIRDVFTHITLPDKPEVLELGAGRGFGSLLALEMFKPKRLVVTDYDSSQVEEAKKAFIQKMGELPEQIEFRTADALHLGFEASSFDMVMGFLFLHHLEKHTWDFMMATKGIDEVDRVLRPLGFFVYGEMHKMEEIRQYLKSKGFMEAICLKRRRISIMSVNEFCAWTKPG